MSPNPTSRRFAASSLALALGAGLLLLLLLGGGHRPERAQAQDPVEPEQPNIIFFLTDDQSFSTVRPDSMPTLHQLMIGPGSSFTNYITPTPLCCPSRATTFTGQYGHNNGVLKNDYDLLIGKKNLLPVWMQRAGYNTAHVGKFLNGYEQSADKPKEVAPGWDLWFTQLEKRAYYDWKASKNGKKQRFGRRDKDHLITVTNKMAKRWAKKLAKKDEPFYMQVDTYAPHGARGRDNSCAAAPVPMPQDEGRFATTPLPMPANFNEADVSDKPGFIKGLPLIDAEGLVKVERHWRCTMESVYGVDRGIRQMFAAMRKLGELDNTIFIFASDNGYFFGEHRVPKGKQHPYDENLKMPLTILAPPAYRDNLPQVTSIDAPTANLDLAPTILDFAGADSCRSANKCRVMDGRSLRPLLTGDTGDEFPDERAFAIEHSDCLYRGVREGTQMYLEHGGGPIPTSGRCKPLVIEHYDVGADPAQLENLYPASRRSDPGRTQLRLQGLMSDLIACAGIEGRDPPPVSGIYCQ